MEYCLVLKKEILFATTQMNLDGIKINQTQKEENCISLAYMWNLKKSNP